MYKSLNIAEAIKTRAKDKGISLKDMLSDLSLGSNTMSNMRHDKMIAADSLARIADYLDCSVDYLLGRTNNPEINRDTTATSPIENDGLVTNEKMTEILKKIPSTPKELEKLFTPVEPHKNTTG